MYTAFVYVAFKRGDGEIGKRHVCNTELKAQTLNEAKAQATRVFKNHSDMSKWYHLDKTSKWGGVVKDDEGVFARRKFVSVPEDADQKALYASIDILMEKQS